MLFYRSDLHLCLICSHHFPLNPGHRHRRSPHPCQNCFPSREKTPLTPPTDPPHARTSVKRVQTCEDSHGDSVPSCSSRNGNCHEVRASPTWMGNKSLPTARRGLSCSICESCQFCADSKLAFLSLANAPRGRRQHSQSRHCFLHSMPRRTVRYMIRKLRWRKTTCLLGVQQVSSTESNTGAGSSGESDVDVLFPGVHRPARGAGFRSTRASNCRPKPSPLSGGGERERIIGTPREREGGGGYQVRGHQVRTG